MQCIGAEKAFVLAGGFGARLRPLTDKTPKPLVTIKGIPVLERNLLNLKKFGVELAVIGLGHRSGEIMGHFEKKDIGMQIEFSLEEKPLGTAGAVKHAERFFSEKFVMCNGDEAKEIDYARVNGVHEKNSATATIALTRVDDVEHFGSVHMKGDRILDFAEKASKDEAPSNLVNAGAYILEPEVFSYIEKGRKVSIEKDVFPKLAAEGKLFGCPVPGKWFPIDTIERYNLAEKEWKD